MTRPRVILADDHRIVAEGLRGILEPDFDLVAIVEDGRQLIETTERLRPDVIVVDITMPLLNGIEAVEMLSKSGSTAKVVFLTMHKDATYAARAMSLGASAFVLKHAASAELVQAIRAALVGQTFVSTAIAEALREPTFSAESDARKDEPLLTLRQREILQLFAEGRTAREVGQLLNISKRTAENHKSRIMQALGVTTSSELVQYAMRHGMIAHE
jgi:DNA-binding NarL/FixJ family response regulator